VDGADEEYSISKRDLLVRREDPSLTPEIELSTAVAYVSHPHE
jgi:hypothetical protein